MAKYTCGFKQNILQYIAKPGQAVYFTFSRGVFRTFSNVRSSRLEVLCRKGVLRNFAKFTGKHLFQNPFFNKVADLEPPVAASETSRQGFCLLGDNYFHKKTPS